MNSKRTKQINSVKRDEKLKILRKARTEELKKKQMKETLEKINNLKDGEVYISWLGRYVKIIGTEHETSESLMLKSDEEKIF